MFFPERTASCLTCWMSLPPGHNYSTSSLSSPEESMSSTTGYSLYSTRPDRIQTIAICRACCESIGITILKSSSETLGKGALSNSLTLNGEIAWLSSRKCTANSSKVASQAPEMVSRQLSTLAKAQRVQNLSVFLLSKLQILTRSVAMFFCFI